MVSILPDIVRSAISDICIISLLLTLAQPKYSKKLVIFSLSAYFIIEVILTSFFYKSGNYTGLVYLTVCGTVPFLFLFGCLFKETFMQWCFNVVLTINMFALVTVLSFYIATLMPYPEYSISIIRIVLFAIIIFLFYCFLRPIYRKILVNWHFYFIQLVCVMLSYLYAFSHYGGITWSLKHYFDVYMVLSLLSMCVYVSIILSLKSSEKEYTTMEQIRSIKADEEILQVSVLAMQKQLDLISQSENKLLIQRHDKRHFDATILQLITSKKYDEAINILKENINYNDSITSRFFCANSVLNSIFAYYISLAEKFDIVCEVSLDIPEEINIDVLKLSMAISNLLENAINASVMLPKGYRKIRCAMSYTKQILLVIENYCLTNMVCDENNIPINNDGQYGIGTKSVLSFVKECGGDIVYKNNDDKFIVQMLV